MKYKDIKKVYLLNNYCLVENTEETKIANGSVADSFRKTDSYLRSTPMGHLFEIDERSTVNVNKGDYVLYKKLSELGNISINGREYVIIHDSNLVAKCTADN